MSQIYGIDAILRLSLHLIFIYIAFWAIQSLSLEQLFKRNQTKKIQVFYLLLAIVIGYTVSSFFWECMTLTKNFLAVFMQS
ncbi:DUF1146 family protein [Vagococcus entomophilus]|uniref:DUF1146 domain-containing protein n=1 Tax=Vagococcus entomophilus TaxID=1160095 RepID=A0A430AIM7_9ENTE|nr:DUF1146 family protein [Vagococcus entomophilus]RSU07950.1 hypothetical protein CBF30_01540 [Vagococcus entomophilus]